MFGIESNASKVVSNAQQKSLQRQESMQYKGLRIAIGVITGFIALTAIGGGIALLSGAEGSRFPLEWLQGPPSKITQFQRFY